MRRASFSSAAAGGGRRRHGGGYAESQAPSSIHSRARRGGGGGAASIADSSAWGSDDTGLDSVTGSVHSQYIDALRRSNKRNKAALALPAPWLPDCYWEPVTQAAALAAPPVTRYGFGMVGVPPAERGELGAVQAIEQILILGGKCGPQPLPTASSLGGGGGGIGGLAAIVDLGPGAAAGAVGKAAAALRNSVDKRSSVAAVGRASSSGPDKLGGRRTSVASVASAFLGAGASQQAEGPPRSQTHLPRADQNVAAFELRLPPAAAPTPAGAPAAQAAAAVALVAATQQLSFGEEAPAAAPAFSRGISAASAASAAPSAPSPWAPTAEWQPMPGAGARLPKRLHGCAACALAGGLKVAVFGGIDLDANEVTSSLFLLDVPTGVWRDESGAPGGGPPPGAFAAMAEADGGHAALVHGGQGSTEEKPEPLSSLRFLDLSKARPTWRELEPRAGGPTEGLASSVLTKAPPRRAHSLVSRGGGDGAACAYIFGGYNESHDVCSDVFVIDVSRGICLMVAPAGAGPVARAHHSAVRCGPYMVVFGGINASGTAISELRVMHLPTMLWSAIELRSAPTAALVAPAGEEETRRDSDQDVSASESPGGSMNQGEDGSSVKRKSLSKQSSSNEISRGGSGGAGGSLGDKMMSAFGNLRKSKHLSLMEPPARSQHGAVALQSGSRPGECAMLIFGGCDGQGESLGDAHRLVLELPREPGQAFTVRSHPDRVYEFVMANLTTALCESADHHREQVAELKSRLKESAEEVRNLETRTLGAKAQVEKHEAVRATSDARLDAVKIEIEEEESRLEQLDKAAKGRLRELEIEADSLAAKLQRLRGEQISDHASLSPEDDLDLEGSVRLGEVPNELAPHHGVVERREARWCGARATVEVTRFTPTMGGVPGDLRRSSRSPSPAPGFRSRSHTVRQSPGGLVASRSSSPAGDDNKSGKSSPSKRGHRHTVAVGASDDASQSGAAQAHWLEAAQAELQIVSTLRHPNLQEIFGASAGAHGVFVFAEPFLETLAVRLAREGAGAGAGGCLSSRGSGPRARQASFLGKHNLPSSPAGQPQESSFRRGLYSSHGAHRGSIVLASASAPLTEAQRLHISCDLASGLEYLHSKGVAHRHIILENIFLLERGTTSLAAKLGGHLSARITCRASMRAYVPCQAVRREDGSGAFSRASSPDESSGPSSSLRLSASASAAAAAAAAPMAPVALEHPVPNLADVDVRPVDVFALGLALLRLWVSLDGHRRMSGTEIMNTEDDIALASDKRMASMIANGDAACLSLVRDSSIRFIVSRCMAPASAHGADAGAQGAGAGAAGGAAGRESGRPSAAALRLAFAAVHGGDVEAIPVLDDDDDPSRTALLADLAAELQDDE